ncbi:DNA-directed RNA polymerase subunit beta [Paenibacillus xanthanilyticus]|uniref:DNA-directed RNA polymerase subunit beta n=1 Tax=Paenibacillus xanthanilyticus TaxID=1783531 RepID=A0ABV8K2Z7_9BACL
MDTKNDTVVFEGLGAAAERAASAPQESGSEAAAGKSNGRTKKQQKREARARRHPALRVLLWVLRKSIVPLLLLAALLGGLYIGYTKLGGGSGEDVFEWSTWKHMYDLVFSNA